jgi:hypothetical protein
MESALELFLWSDITIMSTLSLSAVSGLWWELSIASSANHLVAFVLSGKFCKCWLDLDLTVTTSSKSKDKMEGGFLLDVVVRKGSSIFQLLSSKNESLLIRWDTFFVLDLGLHVLNGVCWLNIKSDGFTRERFHENLHIYLSNNDNNYINSLRSISN